jgi:hypothetical protein
VLVVCSYGANTKGLVLDNIEGSAAGNAVKILLCVDLLLTMPIIMTGTAEPIYLLFISHHLRHRYFVVIEVFNSLGAFSFSDLIESLCSTSRIVGGFVVAKTKSQSTKRFRISISIIIQSCFAVIFFELSSVIIATLSVRRRVRNLSVIDFVVVRVVLEANGDSSADCGVDVRAGAAAARPR